MSYVAPVSWTDQGMDWANPDSCKAVYVDAIRLAAIERCLAVGNTSLAATLSKILPQPYHLMKTADLITIHNAIRALMAQFVNQANPLGITFAVNGNLRFWTPAELLTALGETSQTYPQKNVIQNNVWLSQQYKILNYLKKIPLSFSQSYTSQVNWMANDNAAWIGFGFDAPRSWGDWVDMVSPSYSPSYPIARGAIGIVDDGRTGEYAQRIKTNFIFTFPVSILSRWACSVESLLINMATPGVIANVQTDAYLTELTSSAGWQLLAAPSQPDSSGNISWTIGDGPQPSVPAAPAIQAGKLVANSLGWQLSSISPYAIATINFAFRDW